MTPEIINFKPVDIIFVRKTGSYMKAGKAAWDNIMKFAGAKNIINENTKFFGICHDDPKTTPEEKIRYDACIVIDNDIETSGEVEKKTIEAGKYAVFTHKGPYENLMDTYTLIYSKWLPESGHQVLYTACIEEYINYSPDGDPKDFVTKLYIPIQ